MKVRTSIKKEVLTAKLFAERAFCMLSTKRILNLNKDKDKINWKLANLKID